jgi:hypothetical protein
LIVNDSRALFVNARCFDSANASLKGRPRPGYRFEAALQPRNGINVGLFGSRAWLRLGSMPPTAMP